MVPRSSPRALTKAPFYGSAGASQRRYTQGAAQVAGPRAFDGRDLQTTRSGFVRSQTTPYQEAHMAIMAEKPAGDTTIRPFTIETPEADLDDLRARIAATRWPTKELVDDRSQGVQLATMQALVRYWTTEYDFGAPRDATQRTAAVHHRDRWRGHPLHPRALAARGRAAADHDPRLARLGDRTARDRRPADRPDRARRRRRGRVPPGSAVDTRLWLLRQSRGNSAGTRTASDSPGRS